MIGAWVGVREIEFENVLLKKKTSSQVDIQNLILKNKRHTTLINTFPIV
jgi:hypothetical protein